MKENGEYLGLIGLILLISSVYGEFGVWAGNGFVGLLLLLVGFYRMEEKRRAIDKERHARIWHKLMRCTEEENEEQSR